MKKGESIVGFTENVSSDQAWGQTHEYLYLAVFKYFLDYLYFILYIYCFLFYGYGKPIFIIGLKSCL